jgi:hypothetical protein
MIPTQPDPELQPSITRSGGALYFTFRKAAPELIYTPQQSINLVSWTASTLPQQNLGSHQYAISLLSTPATQFMRLQVTLP